jgi:hypothetical protein
VTAPVRERRSGNSDIVILPDITLTEGEYNIDNDAKSQRPNAELTSSYDPYKLLESFLKLNYTERYIDANFQHGKCFINEVKKRYELTGIL